MSHFLYFAYGSNMLAARLRERTPSATVLGAAELPGHALRWHKAGADGSGKCDVVEVDAPDARVYGVLYRIALSEQARLDAAESLGVGYADKHAAVLAGGQTLQARLYVALVTDPALRPFDWYRALVLSGAREHALPDAYVAQLAAVPTRADADVARSRRHWALIGAPQALPPEP
jgi:gamma-glutamylcyclotransferase